MVDELTTTQEEADTRLFLHAAHASRLGHDKFIIQSPDTDVFVMSLPYSHQLDGSFYFKTGTKDKCRIISIQEVKAASERKYLKEDTDIQTFGDALDGLYAFTGCDTVSAFYGQSKIKEMELMASQQKYIDLFRKYGDTWDVTD